MFQWALSELSFKLIQQNIAEKTKSEQRAKISNSVPVGQNIKQHLDEGKVVRLLQTDLSRAFDCIPYKLFVSKLHAYGFSIPACELIFNYYYGRKQRLKLGDNVSEWQNVYKGSAQGSIIGLISYNMFTNDMFMVLDADVQVYNYADDNALVSSGQDYKEAQNNLLKNVGNVMAWFNNNFMQANPNKFKYIVFGNYNNI